MKKKAARLFLLLLCVLQLTSCTTTQYVTVNQHPYNFVGKTHQEVVMILGAPTREYSDGADGYILTFEGNKYVFSYGRKYVRNSDTMPTLNLYFNSDGVCTKGKVTNTEPVKAVSAGWTVLLALLLLPIVL